MKINPNLLVCRTGYVIFVIKVGFLKENNEGATCDIKISNSSKRKWDPVIFHRSIKRKIANMFPVMI